MLVLIRRHKIVHVWIFVPVSFTASLDMSMCLNPSSSNKHPKSPCIAILTSWFGLQSNAPLCLPPRSAVFVFRSSTHALVRYKWGFSIVPWKFARLMSQSSISNDKLVDIVTETSTLLVESTTSVQLVCAKLVFSINMHWNNLIKHILNVLHRSLPVPQLNAIVLIPASSISSVSSSAWWLVLPRTFTPLPESSSLFQDWIPIKRSFWYWTCNLTSCFHIVIILIRLFTKFLQNRLQKCRIAHIQHGFQKLPVQQHSRHVEIHPIPLPNFLCIQDSFPDLHADR